MLVLLILLWALLLLTAVIETEADGGAGVADAEEPLFVSAITSCSGSALMAVEMILIFSSTDAARTFVMMVGFSPR